MKLFAKYKEKAHLIVCVFGIKFKFKNKNLGYTVSGENNKILLK